MYRRAVSHTLAARLREPRRFIQVLSGPRQTGKTIAARQALAEFPGPSLYASADEPTLEHGLWIGQQWELARLAAQEAKAEAGTLLILDEVQKLPRWSEAVKRLWDEDSGSGLDLKVVLLGSSPLLLQSGLTESLAGRFEVLPVTHWSLSEMRDAFGWDLERFAFFGGYPGAAPLAGDFARWSRYVLDSLIETTVARDVLLLTRVDKPALLRRLFHLACEYSGQILSYQKMVGQLQDAGNTTTLAHYLELLSAAGLVTGISKYAGEVVRRRASSPKLLVWNTALLTAQAGVPPEQAARDREFWGRLAESAVGAHLLNACRGTGIEVSYWRERGREVDFVLQRGRELVAVEVRAGHRKGVLPGVEAFERAFDTKRSVVVGAQGVPIDEFLTSSPARWLD